MSHSRILKYLLLSCLVGAAVLIAACGDSDDTSSDSTSASIHLAGRLHAGHAWTRSSPGTLTIGTDKPAYPPYFEDNDPTNGKGFESAVAYAIADQLGFSPDEGRVDGRAVQLLLRARAEGLRLRHQPDLDHADARQAGRLLRAVLHGQPGGRRAARTPTPRRRNLAGGPEGRQDRRPDRHHQPRSGQRRDPARRASRRSSTPPTTSSPR